MTNNTFDCDKAVESLHKVVLAPEDKERVFNLLRVYTAAHPIVSDDTTRGKGSFVELIKRALAIRFRF